MPPLAVRFFYADKTFYQTHWRQWRRLAGDDCFFDGTQDPGRTTSTGKQQDSEQNSWSLIAIKAWVEHNQIAGSKVTVIFFCWKFCSTPFPPAGKITFP